MPYIELYKRTQEQDLPISLDWLINDALELTWVEGIDCKRTDSLDSTVFRGCVIENPGHLFPNLTGNFIIITSTALNRCWERFVFMKELMHIYENSVATKTNSESKFDTQLYELADLSTSQDRSPQMQSEIKAVWMALGITCPEADRIELRGKLEENDPDFTEKHVAEILKIPEYYIRLLMSPRYENEIQDILDGG